MNVSRTTPDLIVLVRRCQTLTARRRRAQAVAISAGRVIAVGTRRSVLRLRGRNTRTVELGSAVLTPGLVDCHTHFFYWALQRTLTIDLSALHSLSDVLRQIRQDARTKRVGRWIIAHGFDHNRWGSDYPHARDLDRAVSDRPVIIHSRDGHTAWLNTRALQHLAITRDMPDPKGGRYLRDARGEPTGILQETAVEALPNPLCELARRTDADTLRTIDQALDDACRAAWAQGFVGLHSMDDGASLGHLLRHHAERRLGLRIVHAIPLAELDAAAQLGLRSGFGDAWLRIGGVKIFADGALGSQTAYMFEPYPSRGEYCGVPNVAGQELEQAVVRAARLGWACWIHAIGDRAVHDVLGAFAAARRVATPAMPHRVEHAQCVRPADVRRMARLGVIASVQPCHLLGDIATADRHWPRARRHTYSFRRMLAAGVTLAGGSDVPIEALDVRRSLHAATLRSDERGRPTGGWFPQQRITTAETLAAFTSGAALAVGKHPLSDAFAPGAPADFTIWADDPLDVPPQDLLELGILGCVVDGRPHLTSES